MKRRNYLSSVIVLLIVLITCGCALADDDSAKVKMQPLGRSPLLLKIPENVKGDFDVAGEPPKLDFAIFPNQWEGADLWSAWGDSLCASDGNFYASIGDHGRPHGTSYVYKIDPDTRTVELIVDYNHVVGLDEKAKYAPGKIHAPLREGGDSWMYFVGYRGSVRKTGPETGFRGDWLLRYNLKSGKIENLGIMIPHCSVPSMESYIPSPESSIDSAMLYGLAVPGRTKPDMKPRFFAYSIAKKKLTFCGGPPSTMNRAIIVTSRGKVYYEVEAKLVRYDPEDKSVENTDIKVPGNGRLRAASRPDSRGIIYCFSSDGMMFAFNPTEAKITKLGMAFVAGRLYTTDCELSPGGRYLYYIPSAHGNSHVHGTALIQLDLKTGRRKVIAFLNEFIRQKKDYNIGGTYGMALSKDGSVLFVNFNGAPLESKRKNFGLCSAMIVHIPEKERDEEP
ncbi:MAG: hypothetical protein KGZ25_09780 [Planctomycetes bacterium]|nr:hypothetical protein [Planctomycetota bacterium]